MTRPKRDSAPYQPRLRRRDSAWRYAIVVAVGVYGGVMNLTFVTRTWVIVDVVIAIASVAILPLRRRWPVTIATLTMAGTTLSATGFGASVLATVSLATRRRWRELILPAATMVATVVVAWNLTIWGQPASDGTDGDFASSWLDSFWMFLLYNVAILAITVGWGLYIGSRRELVWTLRERARELESEQEARSQQARDAERAQIAREMHDVLAHRISQISLHAGAIAFRTDLSADELRAAAQTLQSSANAALIDLRAVLGVLRDPESGTILNTPQPRFTDIDGLIDQARANGARIVAEIDVADGIDDTIGRTLYRLTQECITNAQKHASGALLTLRIVGSPSAGVDFSASNPLPIRGQTNNVPSSGLGLIGLAERAELAGGILISEKSRGGFAVTCHLPWNEPATQPSYETAR